MGPGGLAIGVTPEGHAWIGALKPVLTITEFSDYQCPYCKRGHEEMRKLIKANPDKIRLVHRHFPLDNSCNSQLQRPFHPFSCTYARFAYCAQKANRFWEANDLLYTKGRRRDLFAPWELAAALKIRKSNLLACEKSPEAAAAVKSDLEAGQALKIRGTPTFVIGDRTYPGFIPPEILDAALAR
jgi:protein-disulfide isomerase